MRAFLDSLWDSEKKQWWTSKGGGALMSTQGRPPAYAYDLLKGSQFVSDPKVAQACRERAQTAVELIGQGPPRADDLGFDYAGPVPTVVGLAGEAAQLMAAQEKDGSWRFDALTPRHGVFEGLDYRQLGPHGAAEVGTTARNAYRLLQYALLTGDQDAYAAGRRALEFMKRFSVPRAAQVWEVPVHTPDVLAAAEALEAYLAAYQYEGRQEDLRYALYWARAGLPFSYFWDEEDKPFLRSASIPVFGATWFQGSWFGRPVQWNGLRYASAILKLSRYDRDFPWRRIAQGITASAMYQQEPKGKDVALWPDSISAIDSEKSGWIFSPDQVLQCAFALMGYANEPNTTVVAQGKDRAQITSGAAISDAKWEGDKLGFTLAYPKRQSGFTLIAGLSEPAAVLLNGAELAQSDKLEAQIANGWRYAKGYGLLVIRVAVDGKSQIEVRGARPGPVSLLPQPTTAVRFEFENTPEGWIAARDLENFRIEDGCLKATTTGPDPYMTRSRVAVSGDSVSAVLVRMSVSAGSGGQFFWTTQQSPEFSEDKSVRLPLTADGEFHDYRLAVGDHKLWHGQQITAIRLDPTDARGAEIRVDWMRCE
jgi:hypothetical protein